MSHRVEKRINELKDAISTYSPGSTFRLPRDRPTEPPIALRIGLFGPTGVGKSALINSMNYATGPMWENRAPEGFASEASKTLTRNAFPMTEKITMVDNRGMRSLGGPFMVELGHQIAGVYNDEQSVEWDHGFLRRVVAGLERTFRAKVDCEIHCAVLVISALNLSLRATDLKELIEQIKSMTGITMTEPTSYSRPNTRSHSKRMSEEPTKRTTNGTTAVDRKAGQWGRAWEVDVFTTVGVLALLTLIPLVVFYVHVACTHYQCSLITPPLEMQKGALTLTMLWDQMPSITWDGVTITAMWMTFQVVLFYLPDLFQYIIPGYVGGMQLGAVTPSGIRNPYLINGLQAWFISNAIFVANALYFEWFSPSIVFDHRGSLLWCANAIGIFVATFAIVKAYFFPTHAPDRVFTGNIFYDYMMGIEFNPRIGKMFDFKLFFNGRPGIAAWTIINFSMAMKQYELYGYITNSMILVNFLELIYVVDYFWNEAWYLHTIDMHHDHFGWYLAWGDMVYLPFMYTLQCFYLVFNPVDLSWPIFTAIFLLGTVGYYIFRSVNRQKDYFRRTNGQAPIWGAMPKYIDATYMSGDGEERKSKLLLSGWWGITRHMNYTGDLMQAAAWCLSCGVGHIFPYYYLVFMLILLIHRCRRDEDRCHAKYGKSWDLYMEKVPCRLIPYIY